MISLFTAGQHYFTATVRPTCRETEALLPDMPVSQLHNSDCVISYIVAPTLIFDQYLQDIQFRFFL